MQSRVEKFKKLREELAFQTNNDIEEEDVVTSEDIINQNDNHAKKNTLKLSIDQILEAHDEYNLNVEKQKEKEYIKKKNKIKRLAKARLIGKIFGICFVLFLILIVIIIVIIILSQ